MYVEKEVEKIYWTIGETAEFVGVAPSCIRFWQKEFNIEVRRTPDPKHNRRFTKDKLILFMHIREALQFFSVKGLQMMDLDYLDVTLDAIKENVKECYIVKV